MSYYIIGFSLYFMVICGIAANNKNRNVLGWGVGGGVGGLLVFVVLILSANLCRECGQANRASYCPCCGHKQD